MENNQVSPSTIVVGVDYSESSTLALDTAFSLAAQRPGGEPHVIHVAAEYGSLPSGFAAINVQQAREQLEGYVQAKVAQYVQQHPGTPGFERVCTHYRLGNAADEIAQLAVDLDADLILVGTHSRRGIERLLLGSVAERVVRIAPCPVLVVRPKEASGVPEIEPACPRCVETRQQSAGKELWCQTHRERHGSRHTYHYVHRNVSQSNHPLTQPLSR